ncbi:hypothetical protein KUTeg_008863 [Tegillarca granosa]|uniref:Uncharacterized protein n=1 Tax=Tegillarca granosa TaxID=220873 RepID=A0ABQ9FAD4_TEGGR|nr:hypothetical protein KUTeg_008863 [Tegillarca granosa]
MFIVPMLGGTKSGTSKFTKILLKSIEMRSNTLPVTQHFESNFRQLRVCNLMKLLIFTSEVIEI